MIVDAQRNKLRLSGGEWVTIVSLCLGPAIGAGGWLWNLSDRMLLLETTIAHQTAILQRLDNAREVSAVQTEQLKELARRLERLETQRLEASK